MGKKTKKKRNTEPVVETVSPGNTDTKTPFNAEEAKKKLDSISKEEMKVVALQQAKQIYDHMVINSMAYSMEARYEYICSEFNSFAKAYPIVIKFIAHDLSYSEKAFKRFFSRLEYNPGKGMEGFIENQAYYAKYLYEELCKKHKIRITAHQANLRFRNEYDLMMKNMKSIKKDETDAKSEYAEIEKKNEIKRKQELLDFVRLVKKTNLHEIS